MKSLTLVLFVLSCAADPADLIDTGPLPTPTVAAPQHSSKQLAIVAADRRQFEAAGPARFTASPRFGLTAELTAQGLRASAREDSVTVATVAYGRVQLGGAEPELGACALGDERVDAACVRQVEMDHGALTEWWVSRADGLKHGWTLHAPPEHGPVSITVALSQGEVLEVDDDGAGASLLGSSGGLWRYDGLMAWDADGVGLPARLLDEGTQLIVEVDVRGARWPVTVDPALSTETKLTASDGAADDVFGLSVSGAGDIDGDGYDDLVVGAPYDDDKGSSSSATGIDSASEDKLTASDGADTDAFGLSISVAGDIDGDGYDDVVLSAYGNDDKGSDSGSAYVYYGSATGIDSALEDKFTASDGAAEDSFGCSVTVVGDIDGDGYDDVVVGASGDDDKGSSSGSAYVYGGGCRDLDGDGYCEVDCDDSDAATYPGAASADSTTDCMTDADGDGYGDDSPATGVTAGTDCDDGDTAFNPSAAEGVGDGVDQNCDGTVTCYADADDDGTLDGSMTVASADTDCTDAGEGRATDPAGDCDDNDASTYPGAAWAESRTDCMTDADGDGYGDDSPASGVTAGTDCDDANNTISPGDTEDVGDEIDQDCDSIETCYADGDDDGFIDGAIVVSADTDCTDAGEGLATDAAGECDDTDATIHPGAIEVKGDGIDQDCDGEDPPVGGKVGCASTTGPSSAVGLWLLLGLLGLRRR